MADNIFEISVDEHSYRMVLPHWETDYIQGVLASTHQPYELEMLRAMAAMLKPGELVLDIGANIGNHSMYLSAVAGCRVFAFEPNVELYKAFVESVENNGLVGLITVHQKGIGAASGKAHFANHTPDNLGGQSLTVDGSEASDITVVSLDSFGINDTVRAVKVDVEGMELEVLRGARQLLSRDKPHLFVEAQTEHDFDMLEGVLVCLGYVYWKTYNATPTHLFIHKDELAQSDMINRYFEIARDLYKFRAVKSEIEQKLSDANKKYRNANERIEELKEKLNSANEKYREFTKHAREVSDRLNKEVSILRVEILSLKKQCLPVLSINGSHPERDIGLDFSLPEER
ncbi:FkbM family methyltransferase [Nitrincola sp. MINF-07-Sa-05]|uniref:FkbM family methyltransferase n=1 Tax=Nitrincola salilacus TaxID=3400273 RepID=UPI003917F5DC